MRLDAPTMSLATGKSQRSGSPRLAAEPAPATNPSGSRLGGWWPIFLAAWFGLLAGYLDLISMLIKCNWIAHRYYNMSRHFPWMFPAAGLMIFGALGVAIALLALLRPGWVTEPRASGCLAFVLWLSLLMRWPISMPACVFLAAGLAIQTARIVAARPRAFHRYVRVGLPVLVVILILTAAVSFGRDVLAERRSLAAASVPAPDARNVLLIVLDTVRAQSLSLYGYNRDTSPNLARLAEQGVKFDWAIAPAPWTTPTHASLFTGRWPHELATGWNQPLDPSVPTLAEFLSARGYRTAGFVANTYYCSYETGLNRGFAHYEDYDVSTWRILLCSALVQRGVSIARARLGFWGLFDDVKQPNAHRKTAARVNADFLRWLNQPDPRPFFAFLNYYDAHHPYLCAEADDRHFGLRPDPRADYVILRTWWDSNKAKLSAHELELARNAYDDCIASLDRQLGRLLDELDSLGALERTVVIVTADHGEHMGEQGLFGHGVSLYRPEVHVPLLIVSKPEIPAGRVVSEPVSLRDVPQTILDLIGFKEHASFPGHSLAQSWNDRIETGPGPSLPLAELDSPPEADPNHGRSPASRGPMTSVWLEGQHYIRNGDGAEELYDLAADPNEVLNLAGFPLARSGLARGRAAVDRLRQERSLPARRPVQ
jgi:arylsulfatase A-like enzyme